MRVFVTLAGLFLSTALLSPAAHAADIRVLTAGAFKPVLLSQVAAFEQQSGHRLSVDNDTAGELLKRVRSGEAFDLLILTQGGLEQLGRTGEVRTEGIVPLARVGIGIAVKAGQPAPDVSSVEALRKSLLATRALSYMDPAGGSTSGAFLTGLFERMGIAQALRPKSVLVRAGLSAERLLSGEADIAIQQLSELIVVPGATVIGMLPAEVQNFTVYSGAVGARSAQAAGASQLLQWLRDARLKPELESRGLQTP